MKQTKLSVAVKATLAGVILGLSTASFAADKELLDILKANGSISQSQYEKMLKKSDSEVKVSLKGGHLKMKSADGDFKVQIGGRLMADYAAIDDDTDLAGNGSEFRRARLFVKGKIFKDWAYKAQYDFAGNKTTAKSLYLQYNGWKPASITLGNHLMPFGLEDNISSKYITFMERSAINDVFGVSRKNGLSVKTHGDNWTFMGAVHMDAIGAKNNGQDEDYGYGARVTFAPLAGKTQAIHLGASFHHQEYEKGLASGSTAGQQRFRARPEIHTIHTRPFDTKIDGVEDDDTLGLEAAAVFGPLSMQSEYFTKSVNTTTQDVDFDGWYVYGSYFLTGESRVYKAKKGTFSRVKPKSIVGKGGIGAWELGIRYSSIDLYDGTTNPAINTIGEEGDILTVGLNWYATPTVRFMANYVKSTVEHPGTTLKDDDINALMFRGQVDF